MKDTVNRNWLVNVSFIAGLFLFGPSDVLAQSSNDGEARGSAFEGLGKFSIEGRWAELSRYRDGKTTVEMELDHRTDTFIPVEVYWHFSRKQTNDGTRRVLRSETNDAPDDLYLGAYQINRNRNPWSIEFQSGETGIIRVVSKDLVVIGLAEGGGDPPVRFGSRQGKIRSLIAVDAKGNSRNINVFTLRRSSR